MTRNLIGRGVGRLVRLARGSGARARRLAFDRPNDPEQWERAYLTEITPVRSLSSPVARIIAENTSPGDLLLETGCGSGMLSAELATAGRPVELADFSQKILDQAVRLFRASGLNPPRTTLCDITKPLPWPDRSIDVIWSSGVLEHWTDEELAPIVGELARVARKRVISLVPHAGCVLYRMAKHLSEQAGTWRYGREIPRGSLAHLFTRGGLVNVRESRVWEDAAPGLLVLAVPDAAEAIEAWWAALDPGDPAKRGQGYLLLTIGDVPPGVDDPGARPSDIPGARNERGPACEP